MRLLWSVAALTLLLDQLSKWWVVHVMGLAAKGQIDVWPPFLQFRMAWNYGINFGLFSGQQDSARWILIAVATGIVLFVLVWLRRDPPGRAGLVAAGLLIGGAVGNVIDRLLYGAVADFLNMSCCGINNPYAFNVADIAIFAGAIGLVLFPGASAAKDKKAP
ncbi:Lipoprotein signal peptidase [Roseivivax sp. THAF40]|uniref:signal peptidase II n=1 Tax=unclassified Roseivivax TaxID=2639302 RepID=UPI001267F4A7|nr:MULTISPECIES: signal peptidase II [unclassified Roseivivax]QFS84514.1 Lipoprotein signal peptidase [Roseivivax sp. THAF197b]QFT48342.1 Lipoprotein signal peptidase [Roseivivax sp. THAF40]